MSRRRQYTPIIGWGHWRNRKDKKRPKAPRAELETKLRHGGVLSSPDWQIDLLLRINEAVWKDQTITKAAIRELGDPPECPPINENNVPCVALLSDTGDVLETLTRNWLACRFVHGLMHTQRVNGLSLLPTWIKPRKNATSRPKGLRWAICELGRRLQNQRALYVCPRLKRQNLTGLGQELPLIAALHPNWATALDGNILPFVSAPDLEVDLFARHGFTNLLCLSYAEEYGKSRISLGACSIAGNTPNIGHGLLIK